MSSTVSFADIVYQTINLSRDIESENVVLDLIETPWMQRLRDVNQTGYTSLVYMFAEHSRFGHSLGVAYLANVLMSRLERDYPNEIAEYRTAVSVAALLHDIGHLAPGSHIAFKAWFPDQPDSHEEVATRVINEDPAIQEILTKIDPDLPKTVCRILMEDSSLPPWTWQIISGGGWNVDRGNWCIADSIMAGVSYGKYNIPALIDAIVISDDKNLALKESRLDAMMHFAVSRHAMYMQMYLHRVILATDTIIQAIVARARDLDKLAFADSFMEQTLAAKNPEELSLETIFAMRESWWRYHMFRWSTGEDKALADLSNRILNRKLFKTVRVRDEDNGETLLEEARSAVEESGYDPKYYLHEIGISKLHGGDNRQAMKVLLDNGDLKELTDAEPLFSALVKESRYPKKQWIVLPEEAKKILGRKR